MPKYSDLLLEQWESFMTDVVNSRLQLTQRDFEELLLDFTTFFQQKELSLKARGFLEGFITLLCINLDFVRFVDEQGPIYLREVFPFDLFLTSQDQADRLSGSRVIQILYEFCPSFNNLEDYILNASNYSTVTEILKDCTKAQNFPDEEAMGEKYEFFVTSMLFSSDKLWLCTRNVANSRVSAFAPLNLSSEEIRLKHQNQHEEEVLNKEEQYLLQEIRTRSISLSDAKKMKDFDLEMKCSLGMKNKLKEMIQIHEFRNRKREKRFLEKATVIKSEYKGESLKFNHQRNIQSEAIHLLKSAYDDFVKVMDSIYIYDDLHCIDEAIGDVYGVSLSIVISGILKTGKSTVVNCLVGYDLSPHRLEPMTAIPIRYIHTPSLKQPTMLVPFYDELNVVIKKIRAIIEEKGTNADGKVDGEAGKYSLKVHLRKEHLRRLVDKIWNGLTISSKYVGVPVISEASETINDLFRLAVDDIFSGDLTPDLPLDWEFSLDKYLTVYTKFQEFDSIFTGLVNLSIIDTPGIDEYGVRKLKLEKLMSDAIYLGNCVILVTDIGSYDSTGANPLKKEIYKAKKKYAVPVMIVATHGDSKTAKAKADLSVNIPQSYLGESTVGNRVVTEQIFDPSQVFIVSAKMKLDGVKILDFLKTENRIPVENPEDEDESQLAVVIEPWKEATENVTIEYIRQKAQRLVEISNMDSVAKSIQNQIEKAVELAVLNSLCKVKERAEIFCRKLNTDPQALNTTGYHLHECLKEIKRIVQNREAHLGEIKKETYKTIIANKSEIFKFLTEFQKGDVEYNSQFGAQLMAQITLLEGDVKLQSSDILKKKSGTIEFGTFSNAERTLINLNNCFKICFEEYLKNNVEAKLRKVLVDCMEDMNKINEQFRKVESIYQNHLGITITVESFEIGEHSPSLDSNHSLNVRKILTPKSNFFILFYFILFYFIFFHFHFFYPSNLFNCLPLFPRF